MAHGISTYDLGRLGLQSGEAHRAELAVDVEPFVFGGEEYAVADGAVNARLDVSRPTHGHALRLRFSADVEGPCLRCLEPARAEIDIDSREVDDPSTGGEELRSPYVDGDEVDLSAWAHDELALEIPTRLRGCAACREAEAARVEQAEPAREPDPRWAALRDLQVPDPPG